MPSRMKTSARRAYEDPSTGFLGIRRAQILYLGAQLGGTALLLLIGIAPEYPSRGLIVLQTFVAVFLSYVIVFTLIAYASGTRLRRSLQIALLLMVVLIAAYGYLTAKYNVRVPGFGRVVIGYEYTPRAKQFLEHNPETSDNELVKIFGLDANQAYTSSSLAVVRITQLIIWFLLMFLSTSIFVIAIIPNKRLRSEERVKLSDEFPYSS